MKIYRVKVLAESTDYHSAKNIVADNPGAIAWPILADGFKGIKGLSRRFRVTLRESFSHNLELTDKQTAKMLPLWAKQAMRKPKSIGDQVAAFYAENAKVVTDMSGAWVGSDEWLEAQELLPCPFRATRQYLESRYHA